MLPAIGAHARASALRSGLALGWLYGWLLTFPKFGPLLFDLTGESAPMLGLIFVLVLGAAMPVVGILPRHLIESPPTIRWAGAAVALTSLFFASAPMTTTLRVGPLALFLMAILGAYLIQAWSGSFDRSADPITTLVIAMATSRLLVAAVSAANTMFPGEEAVALTLVAGLAMLGASSIASLVETSAAPGIDPPAEPVPPKAPDLKILLPGIAFAVGAYLVAGIWYQILATTPTPEWQWRPVVEALIYALGIILFGDQARRDRPGTVALYSLSLLGLALMGAISMQGEGTTVYRSLFALGRAGADLFFWYFIWRMRSVMGMRRMLGRGLWLSLWMTAIASLATTIWPGVEAPSSLFLMLGAAVLFLITPIASREPLDPSIPAPSEEEPAYSHLAEEEAHTSSALEPPPGLTQSERQIYDLLIRGSSDAEIATNLFITRHTVKFHVRNILHKVGVDNRKELLSRLVHLQQAAGGDASPSSD